MRTQVGYMFKSSTDHCHYVMCLSCWAEYGQFYRQYCEANNRNKIFEIYEDQLGDVKFECVYSRMRFNRCKKEVGNGFLEAMPPSEMKVLYTAYCEMEE